ncbi:unnamed protein product [Calypogeia fissa]
MGVLNLNAGGNRVFVVAAVLLGLLAVGLVEGQSAAGINISVGLCGTLVQPWGYPCNEYTVQTQDGFLLAVQNIPYGISKPLNGSARPPVFLQHGIFAGGDNWVFNGPSESLGHGHINLTTADAAYWNWSWDELAAYDLPAMVGFVYNHTGSKVMYIGHSQVCTVTWSR